MRRSLSLAAFEMRDLRRRIVGWLGRYYHSVPGGGETMPGAAGHP